MIVCDIVVAWVPSQAHKKKPWVKGPGGKARQVKHDIMAKGGAAGLPSSLHPLPSALEDQPPAKQGFFKSTKSKFLMFPFHEEKVKWDDYGEIIKPEDWIDTAMDTDR